MPQKVLEYLKKIIRHSHLGFFIPVFFALIIFQPNFNTNDDVEIRAILNGDRFGIPDSHIPYMNSIITVPLKVAYSLFPNIFWYESLITILTMLCLAMIYYFVSRMLKNVEFSRKFPLLAILAILIFKEVNSVSFTSTSILLAGTGLSLFVIAISTSKGNLTYKWALMCLAFIFLIAGYLFRNQGAAAALILFVPTIIYCAFKFRQWIVTLIFSTLTFISALFVNFLDLRNYSTDGWRKYLDFSHSFMWPYDHNALLETLRRFGESSILRILQIKEPDFNLWLGATNVDKRQADPNFLNRIHNLPLTINVNSILSGVQQVTSTVGLYFLALFIFLVPYMFHRKDKLLFDLSKKKCWAFLEIYLPLFQLLFGLILLFSLTIIRKNVERVSLGITVFVIFIAFFCLLNSTEGLHGLPSRILSKHQFKLGLSRIALTAVLLLIAISTVIGHPHVRTLFGGHFSESALGNGEPQAVAFIESQNQCKGGNSVKAPCVLFLKTNTWSPYIKHPKSTVRELSTFWSAFSPLWEKSILDAGSRNGIELLCSSKGFLLSDRATVTAASKFVFIYTGSKLRIARLESIVDPRGIEGRDLYLTVGTKSGYCSAD